MRVSVFGGAEPLPGEPAYEQALRLGRLLAEAGHTVLTGGYVGTMEAVSQGACQAGGHVIGVTCDEIEAWRRVGPNRWVMEEMRYDTVRQRLYALIENCDAAMALPGGIGTLAEVAAMWSSLQTGANPPRPLILIGDGWQTVLDEFLNAFERYVRPENRRLLSFAPDVESAVRMLDGIL
ncbi:MAG TPA: LOG family protein [Anaerolineales bacterium]|nr:LOG family protein [Anaerolineales bacterium]